MNTFSKVIDFFGNTVKTSEALNVSVQAVCFWRDGKRKLPIDKCSLIELLTNGKVSRQELRPDDWQNIWPELVASGNRHISERRANRRKPRITP